MTPNLSNVTTLDHVELRKPAGPSTAPNAEAMGRLPALPETIATGQEGSSSSGSSRGRRLHEEEDAPYGIAKSGGRQLLAAAKVKTSPSPLRSFTEAHTPYFFVFFLSAHQFL